MVLFSLRKGLEDLKIERFGDEGNWVYLPFIKNMRLTNIIFFAIAFLCISCGIYNKRASFSDEELKWFNVYKTNDTLIFKSLSTYFNDTTIINSKRIYRDYDPFRHDNIIHCVNINYRSSKYKTPNQDRTLFGHCISEDGIKPYINVRYLNSEFKLEDNPKIIKSENLNLSGKSFQDIYELKYLRLKYYAGTDDDPEILYWDKNHGIIKYITFNGEVWERINWEPSN